MKTMFALCLSMLIVIGSNAQTKPKPATTKPKTTSTKTSSSTPIGLKTPLDSFSYAIGMSIGGFYKQQGLTSIKTNLMLKGIGDAMNGKGSPLMTEAEMNQCITEFLTEVKSEKTAAAREASEKFLSENTKKAGVVTLPSGLQYKVLRAGTDTAHPKLNDKVKCHYRGTLINGNEFESSYKSGQPVTFNVSGVIAGWTEALQLMTPGSKWMIFVPSELGYGDSGGPAPGSTLVFEVELLEIIKE